jgi:predicted nucleotidyltransferase
MNLYDKIVSVYGPYRRKCNEVDWLDSRTIFLSLHGSNAYGLDTETSDVDFVGVCIPPRQYFLGFLESIEQFEMHRQSPEEPEGKIYNIKKFLQLACDANPNVLELLFLDPKFWVQAYPVWEKEIVPNRNLFLSKKVQYTYTEYAQAQLKRIRTHKKWLLDPPTHKPTREEFNIPMNRVISNDQRGALNEMMERGFKVDDNFMYILQQENAYQRAAQEWSQYENWKKTRNKARAELEGRFGYDTKHASHLVRLVRQCREILKYGELRVERTFDRDEILGIRRGSWTYEVLMGWVESEASDEVIGKLADESSLPNSPDRKKINELCVKIVQEWNNYDG